MPVLQLDLHRNAEKHDAQLEAEAPELFESDGEMEPGLGEPWPAVAAAMVPRRGMIGKLLS
jgi:hypothetical protein